MVSIASPQLSPIFFVPLPKSLSPWQPQHWLPPGLHYAKGYIPYSTSWFWGSPSGQQLALLSNAGDKLTFTFPDSSCYRLQLIIQNASTHFHTLWGLSSFKDAVGFFLLQPCRFTHRELLMPFCSASSREFSRFWLLTPLFHLCLIDNMMEIKNHL